MIFIRIFVILLSVIITSCSSADSREEKILKYSEDKDKAEKYQIYLVNPEFYTTMGAGFHNKYYQHLIGIARSVAEEKKIAIIEKSIGFYYDKREEKKNKLYLGIDIIEPAEVLAVNSSYSEIALLHLRKYLTDILYVQESCASIFKEKEIVGSLIGIRWERDKSTEMVTIWIDKKDMTRYEKKELTFDEIIQRNFVTNTEGKIIKLLR